MHLKTINLTNFRNHKNLQLDLHRRGLLIRGPNGSGKSNILEAIHLLSSTKSLRVKYDRELIGHAQIAAHIEAKINDKNAQTTDNLMMSIIKNETSENSSSKKAKINGVAKSLNKFGGNFCSVLFTPQNIDLVTGAPGLRRKYLDSVLIQTIPSYKKTLNNYKNVIRQRNKILEKIRDFGCGKKELEYWNQQHIIFSKIISGHRREFLEFVNNNIESFAQELNRNDTTYKFLYINKPVTKEKLNKYYKAEVSSKNTLLGPHRDDFEIHSHGLNMASYSSRGQQRTVILALKLCELEYITKTKKIRPVLLLDDIFSELDKQHKQALKNIINDQQTIITTTAEQIPFEHNLTIIEL